MDYELSVFFVGFSAFLLNFLDRGIVVYKFDNLSPFLSRSLGQDQFIVHCSIPVSLEVGE